VKLYIAAADADGRSHVASTTELEDTRVVHVWDGSLEDIARTVAGMEPGPDVAIEPPAGGARWVYTRFPADADAAAWGYTPMGFHCTRTVDFDFLVSGELDCVLDDETVQLDAGDFIVLRAVNHRWVNRGDGVATMLCLLHQPLAPAA